MLEIAQVGPSSELIRTAQLRRGQLAKIYPPGGRCLAETPLWRFWVVWLNWMSVWKQQPVHAHSVADW